MQVSFAYRINGEVALTNRALNPLASGKCTRANVLALEEFLSSLDGADFSGGDVEHFFSDGLIARKLKLKAGSTIVGKIHLRGQINFLMKGTIRVTTENDKVVAITGPKIIVSPAGTKRAGHAITDVEWVTVSHTNATTVEDAEADLLATGDDDPRLGGQLCLGVM